MIRKRRNASTCRAMLLAEAVVAISLIALILGLVSVLVARYGRSTDYYVNYRRLQLGVESQIDRMRAGALPVEDGEFTDESGLSYEIRVSQPPSAWAPLKQVSIVGHVTGKHSRRIRCELQAYVAAPTATREEPPR